ncbi:MAG: DegV family protein [Clostridium sp.]|jgi:DegV family protein with EDD domain|uniref:DegV family protein n=1 Tax=Clostridium sp. TaxID=1506 RepID=UPI0025C31A62|nr:DegV family protein [Clostridium sp.]MCH3965158.1 DegV family protein [Clostridium sp.]MCI1714379.1 DegV family protein [Clostridium sp.]MCI1798641.1 DegV family protein [Clostridium sp.]MCI1812628.1 DegV family protein [Clostridium sp.]MCI1869450.1 DegV family protein [Clostridium sp.]
MDKIKLITDSTADLPDFIIEKYDIEVLPLFVIIDKTTYRDGIDIKLPVLLEKMKNSDEFPATAQVNPQIFIKCYKKYLDEGCKIISIHLSSRMSGTYQSACIARDALEMKDIVVIDSFNVTSGLGIQVIKAAKLIRDGYTIEQIEKKVLEISPHVKSTLEFNSLDNLVKGGRLSKTAGIIGNILGIKIIIEAKNGEMAVADKVRGSKKVLKAMLDYIDRKGIKEGEVSILLHVGKTEILDPLRNELIRRNVNFIESEVGCVVGVHSGADACGLFFVEDY